MSRIVREMSRIARDVRTVTAAKLFGVIRGEYAGADPNRASDMLAVYVHFDGFSIVHRYVLEQVAALAQAGFRVVFVTHSPALPNIDEVLVHCAAVLHRRNLGHDFGAYGCGLRWIRERDEKPRAVLLMNDSCYGFFSTIRGIDANVASGAADLWGFTESYEHHYHLQSYFLLISQRLFASPAFWRFWDRLPLHRRRRHVILKGEIELSQTLLRSGFRLAARVDYREASATWLEEYRPHAGAAQSEQDFVEAVENACITMRPLNPTHYFWEVLLKNYRVPLIKRDLLRANPVSISGIQRVLSTVAEQHGDISATLEHLRFRVSR